MAVFDQEVKGVDAPALGLAWRAVPDSEVEELASAMAASTRRDPELARLTTRTIRLTARSNEYLQIAIEVERGPQMLSLTKREIEGGERQGRS